MKYNSALVSLVLLFFSLHLRAQTDSSFLKVKGEKHTRKKAPKSNTVCINEIYRYKEETDKFTYKKKNQIREWIEIYNGSDEKIFLEDLFLTDDLNAPTKWTITPRKKKYRKIKKNKFSAICFKETKKYCQAKTEYEVAAGTLYLLRRDRGEIKMLDSITLLEDLAFPYSRYPDGSSFIRTDVLTPGYENLLMNESLKRKSFGLSSYTGLSNASSEEFRNSNGPRVAGNIGFYYRKNLKHIYIERGARLAVRGYTISYDTSYNTTKGHREISTEGKQTTWHLDFSALYGYRLTRQWSVFAGPMFSIRIKSILKYNTDIRFTFFNSGEQVITGDDYYSMEYNDALDHMDFSIVVGLRYNWKEKINFSLYYMRDFGGGNLATSMGSTSFFDGFFRSGAQVTSGLYAGLDIPLFSSKKRTKVNWLFD